MPNCAICPTGRPKYEADFIRQPIEGVTFEESLLHEKYSQLNQNKKLQNFFSGFRIRIFDPDSIISGFFEFFEFSERMEHS